MANRCEFCGYHYQTEEDKFPCCHYSDPWPAPCEQDDDYEEEEEDRYTIEDLGNGWW